MSHYLLSRVLQGVLCVWGVTVIIFLATRLSGGDVALLLLPPDATYEDRQALNNELGLDRALPEQYVVYIANALRGDFGQSFYVQEPASTVIQNALPPTLALATVSMLLALSVGIPLGVLSAMHDGRPIDYFVRGVALLGQSLPTFALGIILILVFSVRLGWFPAIGYQGVSSIVLPALTLGGFTVASQARITRSAMLDTLSSEYVRTARAKGLRESTVVLRHAFRNALVPIVSLTGLQFGAFIGGAVVVESIFAWPGLGRVMVDSISHRDYTVVQAGVLVISAIFIALNILVDFTYCIINPQVRLG